MIIILVNLKSKIIVESLVVSVPIRTNWGNHCLAVTVCLFYSLQNLLCLFLSALWDIYRLTDTLVQRLGLQ